MSFTDIQNVINDIVEFIKDAVANMKKFIAGFKTTIKFDDPAADAE